MICKIRYITAVVAIFKLGIGCSDHAVFERQKTHGVTVLPSDQKIRIYIARQKAKVKMAVGATVLQYSATTVAETTPMAVASQTTTNIFQPEIYALSG